MAADLRHSPTATKVGGGVASIRCSRPDQGNLYTLRGFPRSAPLWCIRPMPSVSTSSTSPPSTRRCSPAFWGRTASDSKYTDHWLARARLSRLSLAPHTSGSVIHRRSAAALAEYGDRMYADIANFSQSPSARRWSEVLDSPAPGAVLGCNRGGAVTCPNAAFGGSGRPRRVRASYHVVGSKAR